MPPEDHSRDPLSIAFFNILLVLLCYKSCAAPQAWQQTICLASTLAIVRLSVAIEAGL
jgi:hypothetical protein